MPSESYQEGLREERLSQRVVSDANARNSRQLLHAHVYNYLVKNGHYATARQFLREADVPLEEVSDAEAVAAGRQPAGLLPVQLMADADETLLLEWWNCFCRLRDDVDSTSMEELSSLQMEEMPVPLLPNGHHGSRSDQPHGDDHGSGES